MVVNKSKSGIIFFNKKFRLRRGHEYKGYPSVTEYKYLGYWINKNLNPNKQIKSLEKRCNFIIYKINTLGRNSHEFKDRYNLMKVLIKPHYMYGIVMLNFMCETYKKA